MHILAISGSVRRASSNTTVLEAVRRLAPAGVDVELYDGLARLPAFDADVEESGTLPAVVSDLRARVAGADALLVCSPEYAHGMPGSLKNLLDWLVGSLEFPGKRVTLVAASTRSVYAQAQLTEVLRTMTARLIPDAPVVVPLPTREMTAAAIADDPTLRGILSAVLEGLRGESVNQ